MAWAVPFRLEHGGTFSIWIFSLQKCVTKVIQKYLRWKVLSYSFMKCITKTLRNVRNSKIFVSVNPAIVYQIQLRLALADSLLERITKVIQTWLWVECYLVHYKNVSPRKECLKNMWKISNEDCHRVRLGQSMLDNRFPKRELVKKETEMPIRKQQKTKIRSRG